MPHTGQYCTIALPNCLEKVEVISTRTPLSSPATVQVLNVVKFIYNPTLYHTYAKAQPLGTSTCDHLPHGGGPRLLRFEYPELLSQHRHTPSTVGCATATPTNTWPLPHIRGRSVPLAGVRDTAGATFGSCSLHPCLRRVYPPAQLGSCDWFHFPTPAVCFLYRGGAHPSYQRTLWNPPF